MFPCTSGVAVLGARVRHLGAGRDVQAGSEGRVRGEAPTGGSPRCVLTVPLLQRGNAMATVRCPSCDRRWRWRTPTATGRCGVRTASTSSCPARSELRPVGRAARYEEPDDRTDRTDRDDRDDDVIRDDDEVRDAARDEALRAVAAPAVWLEIGGWVRRARRAGLLPVYRARRSSEQRQLERGTRRRRCPGVHGVLRGRVRRSVFGGDGGRRRNMRNLSSRGWAMAAAILGVAAFSVFGVFGSSTPGSARGALMVLDHPAVRTVQADWEPRRRPNRAPARAAIGTTEVSGAWPGHTGTR